MSTLRWTLVDTFGAGLVIIGVLASIAHRSAAAGVQTSHHKNAFWTTTIISDSWHGGGYGEDALDMDDSPCTGSSPVCKTAYFRYTGMNQHQVEYTMSNYSSPNGCTGRAYTLNYYSGGQWHPLIRLNFVHLQSMRASSQGLLDYAQVYNEWVGAVAPSQVSTCGWTAPHLHYSRSLYYGLNDHNSTPGFAARYSTIGSDAIVFQAYD